jgi:hypothetical protein
MATNAKQLFDDSINHLMRLAALLEAEVHTDIRVLTPEQKACEGAVERISTLIPTLKVARNVPLASGNSGSVVHYEE